MKQKILDGAHTLIKKKVRADKIGIAELTAAGVCTPAEFAAEFADAQTFQRELTQRLFTQASEKVFAATAGASPGLEQIMAAFTAYLDHNLAHPEIQQLAHTILVSSAGQDLLQRMEMGVAMVAQSDVKAMGGSHPVERARMLTALTVYTVRAEFKAQQKLPALREVLFDFCRLSAKA